MKEGMSFEAPNNGQESEVNFHEVSERRKELRGALKKFAGSRATKDAISEPLKQLNEQASEFSVADFKKGETRETVNKDGKKETIKDLGWSGAKEVLKKQKGDFEQQLLDEHAQIDYDQIYEGENGKELHEIKDILNHLAELRDLRMKASIDLGPGRRTTMSYKKVIENVMKSLNKEIKDDEGKLAETDPLIRREAELVEYKENLAHAGHICITPEVEKDLEAIGDRMLTGKPMFLHGPTGTGKTSLARFAATHFTGKDPEMVFCNPQTKESNVWGKTGIKPAQGGAIETVEIYGPLAKAMIEGKTVIFDEFTALPKEQMVFIKGVFNAKVGDRINIVGNGIVDIAPGFQMIFTANLKSEKNPERQDLPPEIAREFEQNNLEVKYTKPDEAYDIMLSRLMNRDGSLDMSFYDLNTTLPNLCRVMSEIQESYTNETDKEVARRAGAMDASGKVYSLKKFVMTQGSVEAILSAWQIEKQTGQKERSFSEFLDERFMTALTFKEYPKEDRILVAKILASKGFLLTVDPKELDLPEDIFKLNTIKTMRGEDAVAELQEKSGAVKHLSLKEVAELDPFGRRAEVLKNQAEALLGDENKKDPFLQNLDKRMKKVFGKKDQENSLDIESLKNTLTPFLQEAWKSWGVDAEKIKNAVISPELISPQDLDYPARQADIDETKFGEFTVNPDTQNLDWESLKEKIFIPDPKEFADCKTVQDVANKLIANYSDKYRLPGLEFWKFMIENPDKVPDQLKDGNYYYNFGSLVRYSGGRWYVPCAEWSGSVWNRVALWLGHDWFSNFRVVLLEI